MIYLRALHIDDAPSMLEWMHNPIVQKGLQKNMLSKTIDDAREFCSNHSNIPTSLKSGDCIHFAISNTANEYLGTVSLKNINLIDKSAEYAIVVHPVAQGKGVATAATKLIIEKAFNDYMLHKIYLNVLSDNTHAIHLYQKCGFIYERTSIENHITYGTPTSFDWYCISKSL